MAFRVTADGDDGPSTNDLEDGSKPSVEEGETVETTKPNEGSPARSDSATRRKPRKPEMTSLQSLIETGKSLGLTGVDLHGFIKEQQELEREERRLTREGRRLAAESEERRLAAESEERRLASEERQREMEYKQTLELERLRIEAAQVSSRSKRVITSSRDVDEDGDPDFRF